MKFPQQVITSSVLFILLVGCTTVFNPGNALEYPASQTAEPISNSTSQFDQPKSTGSLSPDQVSTLSSLEKVDDYPLYTMNYQGNYEREDIYSRFFNGNSRKSAVNSNGSTWACSLFAALGAEEDFKFGRNFDWEYSPGLLLFTNPPGSFASVSMVDIAYLDFEGQELGRLEELKLSELTPLLDAPHWPFDGMNERGLAIGMAAVPSAQLEADPEKTSIGSLGIMRLVLDNAADVNEAVAIMDDYNIDFRGGPNLHYLIADQSGEAVLIEFYRGEMHVIPNQNPWHQATNFLLSYMADPKGQCTRYDRVANTMLETGGNLEPEFASELLSSVSQSNTQWSVIYNLHNSAIHVIMGRQFDQSHVFQLIP